MSKELITQNEFTNEQLELIKSTVAKGATNDELKLFLYRAKNMGLDPLKVGQIYFVKYGNNPGTIIIGLDGFRAIAGKSNKHSGTERGVTRNAEGRCISAWCKVYRHDWQHAAFEEVSMSEYNTGKAKWASMPETMLKKVAECAALRMAFPDQLGEAYSEEEMDQASRNVKSLSRDRAKSIEARIASKGVSVTNQDGETITVQKPQDPSKYIFKTGTTRKGKTIESMGQKVLSEMLFWYDEQVTKGRDFSDQELEDFEKIHQYLEATESVIGEE